MSSPVLVTGATGLVGFGIARLLASQGRKVRALVRDAERARRMLGPGIETCTGDVTLPDTLDAAVRGTSLVFHAAGIPEQWQKDETVFDRVNRGGTANLVRAALRAGVERVVYTSTMDVFAAPRGGMLVETNVDQAAKPTAYERSKQAAEREVEALLAEGLDVVLVNPGAVYGPSPVVTALNVFFSRVLAGKVPLLPPGGMPVAFVDGVAKAHLAAAERGVRGERYLVADEHASMQRLATTILAAEGRGRRTPAVAPAWLLKALASSTAPLARTFGFTPLIAPGELCFVLWNVSVDASKAKRELGFEPTPLVEGVQKTVAALGTRT
jgi:nucleoside-diphosphate-sugar epimerase